MKHTEKSETCDTEPQLHPGMPKIEASNLNWWNPDRSMRGLNKYNLKLCSSKQTPDSRQWYNSASVLISRWYNQLSNQTQIKWVFVWPPWAEYPVCCACCCNSKSFMTPQTATLSAYWAHIDKFCLIQLNLPFLSQTLNIHTFSSDFGL